MARRKPPGFTQLLEAVEAKLRPPFGILMGSPREVAEIVAALPSGDTTCLQFDLYQAQRLKGEMLDLGTQAEVTTAPDLWDLPQTFQTLIYPVPYGGERELKLDVLEQAQHILKPVGTLIVLSPYDRDRLFPPALKKIYGKVHAPMAGHNKVLWVQRDKERPKRRHEVEFQIRVDGESLRFTSRPGVFSYGRFDDGARALTETMEIREGDRVLDMGCGCGTNGILAARRSGPAGSTVFADSNVRAIAVTELNAQAQGVANFETLASFTMRELKPRSFDVVLANPPYYAQLEIAQMFIHKAFEVLKKDGRLYLVTKQPDIVGPVVAERFGPTEVIERRGYVILAATRN